MDPVEHGAPIEALLANHLAFVRYLERRVGDRALAEDILQDAFAKIVARPEQTPADEGVVPWFYSTLRNAAIDQFRRRGAAHRAYEAFARELEAPNAPSDDMQNEIATRAALRKSVSGIVSKVVPSTSTVRHSDVPQTEQQRLRPTLAPSHSSIGLPEIQTRFDSEGSPWNVLSSISRISRCGSMPNGWRDCLSFSIARCMS